MTYKEINPTVWEYKNDGDFIEGVVLNKEDNVGKNESWLYNLETPAGVKSVWGATILDTRMVFVKVGDKIKITYKGLGKAKDGRNAPKLFSVLVDRDDEEDLF